MEISKFISFIKELEGMKIQTRTAYTSNGKRESIAEHSWRLSMMCLFASKYVDDLDINKVIQLSLVHDLGEIFEGDISAKILKNQDDKLASEEEAIKKLGENLRDDSSKMLLDLWSEYSLGKTQEALFVKALDKLETIIQHNQGINPKDFDYIFNLDYGAKYTNLFEVTKKIREEVDSDTKAKIND